MNDVRRNMDLFYACTVIVISAAIFSSSFADVDVDHNNDSLTVRTTKATFHGKHIPVNPYLLPDYHGGVAAYTRIPYAEPPVDDLRFRRPVPKVVEGDFDATRDAVMCPQVDGQLFHFGMDMSEDCLYLDIFVPQPKPVLAAVMVWIHGGSFVLGAGSVPRSLPIPLAAMNDVILVTINYRLNAFGFLATGDDESSFNVGLWDQRQALLWIQENIAAFGGDPTRVTIFGESAGGFSVHAHVLSPMSAGLFSGGIMQSGVTTSDWGMKSSEDSILSAFKFGSYLNCHATTSKELITCLRNISVEEIIKYFAEDPTSLDVIDLSPTIDGEFFPRDPRLMSVEGEVNQVSVMIGCQKDEGRMFITPKLLGGEGFDKPVLDRKTYDDVVSLYVKDADALIMDAINVLYIDPQELAKPEPNYADTLADALGDLQFLCPTFDAAEDMSAAGIPVYSYLMTHVPESSFWGKDMTWLGATHAEDIPYVFGSPFMLDRPHPNGEPELIGIFNEHEIEMSKQIMMYWSNFAKTGDPNLSSKEDKPTQDSKYPQWPLFTKDKPHYKDLSLTFANHHKHPSPKSCHFAKEVLPKLQSNAAEMARLKSILEVKVSADISRSCDNANELNSCPQK